MVFLFSFCFLSILNRMAKLAKKKKEHQMALQQKKSSHSLALLSIKTNFKAQIDNHKQCLQAASVFIDSAEGPPGDDLTKGWVQLWDSDAHNCYYWHPDK